MFMWMTRILVVIAGPVIGWFQVSKDWKGILLGVGTALFIVAVEIMIEKVPLDTIILGGAGALLGLIAAKLLDYSVTLMGNEQLDDVIKRYSLLIKIVLGYLGLVVAIRKKGELDLLDKELHFTGKRSGSLDMKVVDTSAIIDGRLAEVVEAGFISGGLVVPSFVLRELQEVADSSDAVKRARGRRGLDILKRLQESPDAQVRIFQKDYPDLRETDLKLIRLAQELQAKILTTDFNLNKVAQLQGVAVLNVNVLANALKPAVLPGEGMSVFLVKEGKERRQGVGHLEDGTMVVVEDARVLIGQTVNVIVTSIIQTAAGRMIFTRLKENGGHSSSPPGHEHTPVTQ